jgi:hypothetical protein
MSKNKNDVELLPVLLNGKPYRVDETGEFAINTDGRMIPLMDRPKDSRFK